MNKSRSSIKISTHAQALVLKFGWINSEIWFSRTKTRTNGCGCPLKRARWNPTVNGENGSWANSHCAATNPSKKHSAERWLRILHPPQRYTKQLKDEFLAYFSVSRILSAPLVNSHDMWRFCRVFGSIALTELWSFDFPWLAFMSWMMMLKAYKGMDLSHVCFCIRPHLQLI